MKVVFKGRLLKEGTKWQLPCDLKNDNYSINRRSISVVVCVNGHYEASVLESFEIVPVIELTELEVWGKDERINTR